MKRYDLVQVNACYTTDHEMEPVDDGEWVRFDDVESEASWHFNVLTPAEAERLALMLEECGEVQQIIGKILRHGYESRHPNGGPTNREMLERELGDLHVVGEMLIKAGDVRQASIEVAADGKAQRMRPYLHHQGRREEAASGE